MIARRPNLQRYLDEPGEAGLFYIRHPGQAGGQLLGILLPVL